MYLPRFHRKFFFAVCRFRTKLYDQNDVDIDNRTIGNFDGNNILNIDIFASMFSRATIRPVENTNYHIFAFLGG